MQTQPGPFPGAHDDSQEGSGQGEEKSGKKQESSILRVTSRPPEEPHHKLWGWRLAGMDLLVVTTAAAAAAELDRPSASSSPAVFMNKTAYTHQSLTGRLVYSCPKSSGEPS